MKLGLSVASYRWVCYPPTLHDNHGATIHSVTHPAYLNTGMPLPYTLSITPPAPGDHIEWTIDRAVALRLSPLYLCVTWFDDEDHARQTGRLMAEKNVKLIAAGTGDWATTGDEWQVERDNFVRHMRLGKAAGADIIVAVHHGALEHHHFSKDPPIAEQIKRMIANFNELTSYAEAIGIVMAFENHMDYRCTEIAEVVSAVDSPWLRVNYDFGNSLAVIEDPLEAAKAVAEWTVMTHIKDMRIQSKTLDGEPRILTAPLGQGDVPIPEILEVLQSSVADPDNLALCVEVAPQPHQDPEAWMQISLAYMRENFGQYLT